MVAMDGNELSSQCEGRGQIQRSSSLSFLQSDVAVPDGEDAV